MPSFDIVSEVEMPEVRNGVENATREGSQPVSIFAALRRQL